MIASSKPDDFKGLERGKSFGQLGTILSWKATGLSPRNHSLMRERQSECETVEPAGERIPACCGETQSAREE